ncbi:MAG: TspO/MBR family protein [Microcoleaceae cyanobacterium]
MIRAWMGIVGVVLLVVWISSQFMTPDDQRWFNRLQRPRWLTFESWIPLIWTVVFICATLSAILVWNQAPGTLETWLRMGLYLLLEAVTLAYTSVMCKFRSLRVGTMIGGTGAILSMMLALSVLSISSQAAVLLLPYILWSPIGTYTTWAMIPLNSADA